MGILKSFKRMCSICHSDLEKVNLSAVSAFPPNVLVQKHASMLQGEKIWEQLINRAWIFNFISLTLRQGSERLVFQRAFSTY